MNHIVAGPASASRGRVLGALVLACVMAALLVPFTAAGSGTGVPSPVRVTAISGDMADGVTWDPGVSARRLRGLRFEVQRQGVDGSWRTIVRTHYGATSHVAKVTETGSYRYRVIATDRRRRSSNPSATALNRAVRMSRAIGAGGGVLRASNGEIAVSLPAGTFAGTTTVTVVDAPELAVPNGYAMSRSFSISAGGAPLLAGADFTFRYHAPITHPQVVANLIGAMELATTDDLSAAPTTLAVTVDTSTSTFSAHVTHFTYFEGVSMQPHGTSPSKVNYCVGVCHNLSSPGDSSSILPNRSKTVCYNCHGANLSSEPPTAAPGVNIQALMNDCSDQVFDPATKSRHPVEAGKLYCTACHNPHRDPAAAPGMLRVADAFGRPVESKNSTTPGTEFCWACHGTRANAQIERVVPGYYARTGRSKAGAAMTSSPHYTSVTSDSKIVCMACHDAHGSNLRSLLATNIAGKPVGGSDNSACFACHGPASSGYAAGTSKTALGYPLDGSYPGSSTYVTVYNPAAHTGSAHTTVTASWPTSVGVPLPGGACANCHDLHSSVSTYDALRTESTAGVAGAVNFTESDLSFCFTCHDADGPSRYDIAAYFPAAAGGYGASARAGHQTTTDGVLPAGSALPCYMCHNPHGAKAAYGLTIVTRSGGATIVVGDASGEITMSPTTRTAADVRRFCFTCHTTSDTGAGWTGAAMTVVGAADRVLGIPRLAASAGRLRLPVTNGHALADAQSCYQCHGSSYASPTSSNVHSPSGGVSGGGTKCYSCHGGYQPMDMFDASDVNAYHHVMGTSTIAYTGDIAPNAGAYPTSNTDLYCVSCHVDHNYFNKYKGYNLRSNVASSVAATANTDWVNDAGRAYGICLSCHTVSRAKDTTHQKSDGFSTATGKIAGATYAAGSHQYSVSSSYGANASDAFAANCSKCHNDEQSKDFQTSAYGFGTHLSADRRILSAFGATVLDPAYENDCFGCHSETSDVTSGTTKPLAGRDAYGNAGASMDTTTQKTYKVFHLLDHSAHTDRTGPDAVGCPSCHNVHATSNTTKVVDPFNTYKGAPYSTFDQRVAFCTDCHTTIGTQPLYQANDTTWVPMTVAFNGGTDYDKTDYGARGHWSASGSIQAADRVSCDTCHDKHGSSIDNLLGVYDVNTGQMEVSGTVVTGNDKGVCYACHTNASTGFPAYSRLASGYPGNGTWPGRATYDAFGKHGASCTGMCHDVHGTANPYDELGTFTETNFATCFTCHSSAFPAWNDIKRYYPVASGGTGTGTRAGHQTTTDGVLPAGSALPCYDCHNPHGSAEATYALMVVTRSGGATIAIGDGSNEISVTTPGGVRRFCFTCHTSSDTGAGWTGAATSVVLATDRVEGISRFTASAGVLRLPVVNGHRNADTDSCYKCHGNSYVDASSNNVHNPSGGLSAGGQPCYGCHGAYQGMDDFNADTSAYHHVMGTSAVAYTGDIAPNTGVYPTSSTDLYCVSCHTDHNYFNGSSATSPAANLRIAISNTSGSAATNTDFLSTGTYGICLSCHNSAALTKDNTNQKSDGRSAVASISGADYTSSSHNYTATSSYGASTFRANCSKCHNDDMTKDFQTSADTFGTHLGTERNILSALGGAMVDPLDETECYGCHTGAAAGNDYYGVRAMGQPAKRVQSVFAKASKHPVVPSGGASMSCLSCHNVHEESSANKVSDPDNTYVSINYSTTAEKATYCLKCHDGAPPNAWSVSGSLVMTPVVMVQSGMNKAAYAADAHWTASGSISAAEVVACASCHDNHGSAAPKLLGAYQPASDINTIGAATITANDNSVCFACHTGASTGFPYAASSRTASGYPKDGTWPGSATYTVTYNVTAHTGSAHTSAGAVWPASGLPGGDCKNCHDVHGTGNDYDELVATFTPKAFDVCFTCHDVDGPSQFDIKSYFPTTAGGDAIQTSTSRFGHKVATRSVLPAGSALPCYYCHNPHGSASNFGLQVVTMSGGTTITIGDSAGEIDMTATPAPRSVREFCFTCHTSSDTGAGWTGTATSVVLATDRVVGISRLATSAGDLRLPAAKGHRNADTDSCYKCHGNSYADATSFNVHNPSGGLSQGGEQCYGCHANYQPMDAADAANAAAYHHVMGTSTVAYTGDLAPKTGAYPTSNSDVYCVSCHADHNYFNADKAFNLRTNIASSTVTTANTDFSALAGNRYGICLSCHGPVALAKDNTNQKPDGRSAVASISGADYTSSSHNYTAASAYGASTFSANCSKCHNDDMAKDFQSAGNQFGTHLGTERNILSALGAAMVDPLDETECYGCHTGAAAGNDYYGVKAMGQPAKRVQSVFAKASKHPVVPSGGASMSCLSCHNVHEESSANKVSDPDNTYVSINYSTTAEKATYCLRCHDGAPPNAWSVSGSLVMTPVVMVSAGMNKAAYASDAHWTASGSISAAEVVACASCHDNHGSAAPKLLGAYQPASDINTIGAATITANDNSVCFACHTGASTGFPYAASSRTASGYPKDGTWPGSATYTVTYNVTAHTGSAHTSAGAVWPASGLPGGDCKNCHDVHGTGNDYDELVATFTPKAFGVCFTCHDGGVSGFDIKSYFPTTAGGTATQLSTTRFGHKTTTAGVLPAGSALPCYYCHNPHGSASNFGLQVVTMSGGTTITIGDAAGDLAMTSTPSPQSVRRFCFTCHTSCDTGAGWTGTATSVVLATDRVAGISRLTTSAGVLRLPVTNGHRNADTADSCYKCHGGSYAGAASNNVHNPSGGISVGGQPCYGCHGAYQSSMEDSIGAKTGATNMNSYHHVLGSASSDGDTVTAGAGTGVYPTSATDVYCISCHTDHNYFNGSSATSPAANLRIAISNTSGSAATSTDFSSSGSYGICVSCHSVARAKQGMSVEQSGSGLATTPIIPGADFAASAHEYVATSTFGSSSFRANCSKCHNDERAKEFQSSADPFRFGTHWSGSVGILGGLGSFVGNPPQEEACYACHNKTGARYGETLSSAAASVQAEFSLASAHPLAKVACVNCHNVHEANVTTPAADPDNTYAAKSLASTAAMTDYCLACHDGTLPQRMVSASTLIPYTVSANATANVDTYYTVSGHGQGLGGGGTSSSITTYATAATAVSGAWTNLANSVGSGAGVANSPNNNNAFNATQTFSFPTSMTAITAASITVRSQAQSNGWGRTGPAGVGGSYITTFNPVSDVASSAGWTPSTVGASGWSLVDDYPTLNTADRVVSPATANAYYLFGSDTPTLPSNATNIAVSLWYNCRGNTSGATINPGVILRVNGSDVTSGSQSVALSAYTTYTVDYPGNPNTGSAWTAEDINGTSASPLQAFGVWQGTNVQIRFVEVFLTVSYDVPGTAPVNDDQWCIEYTTNNWSTAGTITAASTASETVLTDHTASLTSILTTTNAPLFKVRIRGIVNGSNDQSGSVDWDYSKLDLTYTGGGSGPGVGAKLGCRDCHEQHGSSLPHLLSTSVDTTKVPAYSDASDQAQCLACHRSGGMAATSDIARYFPAAAYGTAASSLTRSGHRTLSAGVLPAGSALPCRSCHNPHGSAEASYALLIVTQTGGGTTTTVGDASGEITMTGARTDQDVRHFCFICHTTAGATTAGWNGTTLTVVAAPASYLGISRTTYSSTGAHLKLPDVSGHRFADAQSCYLCHGNSYVDASSNNVHKPSGGISDGGESCYGCHGVYQSPMEDGAGAKVGATRADGYHHVLGSATSEGDTVTAGAGTGAYPTNTTDVYCISCHTDHNYFNGSSATSPAANLRISISNASGSAATNTDFIASGSYGICLSCHGTAALAKDNANQMSDGRSNVASISGGDYAGSSHNYSVTSTLGASAAFRANCSKCHSDEQTKDYQSSPAPRQFGTHWSAERNILSALGGTLVDPLEEDECFRCHSGDTAGSDFYGIKSMSQLSRRTATVFSRGSSHPVDPSISGGSLACVNCHNVHEESPASKVSDPDNTYASISYSTDADKRTFCLKCHDGGAPAWSVTPSLVMTGVVIPAGDATVMNKKANEGRAHWTASGSISAAEAIPNCGYCHDKHGSVAPKLLGAYQPGSGINTIGASTITANDNSVCFACHTGASTGFPYAAGSRTASGYPTDGTWPGSATYTVTYNGSAHTGSAHTSAGAVWPGSGHVGGTCINCHDVHGAANDYDELVATFTPEAFDVCFTCHDADGPSQFDIKSYFPVAAGGTNSGARAGHKTTTAGVLPAGSALPCYYCHNPHGSAANYGLQVITMSGGTTITIGDTAGDLAMTSTPSPISVRRFCFTCHTSCDTGAGWTGTTTSVVLATDRVAGISRLTTSAGVLRLPDVDGHHNADTAASCYKCHGNSYASPAASNVHNPTGGVSGGGTTCYGCHTTYKAMDMADAADVNSYHHVMGSSTVTANGDVAPGSGGYPTSSTDVYCVSCHSDHNYFNANTGANLRQDIGTAGSNTTNTDYMPSGTYGICLSCHDAQLSRDNTHQKAEATSSYVPTITPADYGSSAHEYVATSTFGASVFNANCSKCHNDDQAKEFQAATGDQFGVHTSGARRILGAMGITVVDPPLEERACYACHSRSSDGYKSTANRDWYGVASMNTSSQLLYAIMTTTSKHPVSLDTGVHRTSPYDETPAYLSAYRHVECADCHDVHAAKAGVHTSRQSTAGPALYGAWSVVPTYSTTVWAAPSSFKLRRIATAATDLEANLCFKCHSSYVSGRPVPPSSTSASYPAGGTDVALDFNPYNMSGHSVVASASNPATGAWPRQGRSGAFTWEAANTMNFVAPWTAGSRMTCSDCHAYNQAGARGPHGSQNRFILKYGPAGANWYRTTITQWNSATSATFFCKGCHNQSHDNGTSGEGGTTDLWGQGGNHTVVAGYTCETCHIRIPHAWKRPRMLGYHGAAGDGLPYVDNNLGGLYEVQLMNMTEAGYRNTAKSNWYFAGTGLCTDHNTNPATAW